MNELQLICVGFVVLIFASPLFLLAGYAFWKYIETKKWLKRFHKEEAQKKEQLRQEAPDLYEEVYGKEN